MKLNRFLIEKIKIEEHVFLIDIDQLLSETSILQSIFAKYSTAIIHMNKYIQCILYCINSRACIKIDRLEDI